MIWRYLALRKGDDFAPGLTRREALAVVWRTR